MHNDLVAGLVNRVEEASPARDRPMVDFVAVAGEQLLPAAPTLGELLRWRL